MNKTFLKTMTVAALMFGGATFANAQQHNTHAANAHQANTQAANTTATAPSGAEVTLSRAEVQQQLRACARKQQGEAASYSYRGVTFNGSCQQNADGKLQFKAPTP